jgi:hypothetical protein
MLSKKQIGITLCSLLLMVSCRFASFTERPGVILNEYPKGMYGTYQQIEKKDGVADTHTLVVNEQGAKLKDGFAYYDLNSLDSNSSISHLGDYYYLNVKESDSTGLYSYMVYPFEFDSKNLYIYKIVLSKKNLKRMQKCGLKASGRKTGEFVMENDAFKKFVEKYLRKKDAIKFKKIS